MKVRIITDSFIPKLLKVEGITLYPFVLLAPKEPSKRLISHEMVHVKQIEYYGWFKFYASYLLEYTSYRLRGDAPNVAYHKISYEREAYAKQEA